MEQGVEVPLMIGGLVHQDDHAELNALGVEGIFGPGSNIDDIIEFIERVTLERVLQGARTAKDGKGESAPDRP